MSDSVKYLGVTITSNLRWSTHIKNTCKKVGLIHRSFTVPHPKSDTKFIALQLILCVVE